MEVFPAELTAATADEKRGEHTVARLDGNNVVADLLDDTHRFVANAGGDLAVALAAIEPEI